MYLREVGCGNGLDWCGWGSGQSVNFCECGNESSGFIKCEGF
jgi:hypothetical protein